MTETIVEQIPRPLAIQPEELEMLRPRERLNVAEWALEKRVLSRKTTRFHGPWTHDYTPFLVEIMESLSELFMEQVTVVASVQSGKTEVLLNWLGWMADECPAPTLVVMPTENDVRRRVVSRIRPMFESTQSLLDHVKGDANNINIGEATVLDNMILYLGWAGSPAALADNPCCNVGLDEVGKFPPKSGKEADPVSLAKDRMTTFGLDATLYVASTVVLENDLIDREYKLGDRRQWWVRCPLCEDWHTMAWPNVYLDKDSDGTLLSPKVYENGGHAWYVCPRCNQRWSELQRWQAVGAGKWIPEGCAIGRDGKIIGHVTATRHRSYLITALMLHPAFMTIDKLAKEWAEANLTKKTGDVGPLQKFINSRLAQPWKETEKATEKKKVATHIGAYRARTVPAGVQVLSCGVDIQLDHVWVSVDGWGYLSEAWGIFEGRIETGDTSELENLEVLREFLKTTWVSVEDPDMKFIIYKTAIDSGYRPEVVNDFCRKCAELEIVPVRGDDTVRTRPFRATKIAGGTMIRYDLNINEYKSRLFRLLFESAVPGPGYWHLNAETTDETLSHLTSEEQRPIRSRRSKRYQLAWVPKREHLANHIWDCKVYSAFAAELIGVHSLRSLEEEKPKRPKKKRSGRSGFLDDLPSLS